MNKIKISLSIITASVLASMVTGCGDGAGAGGNDNNNNNNQNNTTQSVKGQAVDGYIRNGFVCIDINNDNECSDGEPYTKTDINGKYNLDISGLTDTEAKTAKIILVGGVDSSSGKAFIGLMKSPLVISGEDVNITPITTMIAAKIVKNADRIKARKEVADTLGLTVEEVDSNPIKQTNRRVYEQSLRIQKTIEMLSSTMGTENVNHNMNKIIKKIAEKFDGNGQKEIEDIINNTTFSDDLSKLENIKVPVKDIIGTIMINDDASTDEMLKVGAESDGKRDIIIDKIKTALESNNDFVTGFSENDINSDLDKLRTDFTTKGPALRLMSLLKLKDELLTEKLASLPINYSTTLKELKILVFNSGIEENIKLKLSRAISLALTLEDNIGVVSTNFNPAGQTFFALNKKDNNSENMDADSELVMEKIAFTNDTINIKEYLVDSNNVLSDIQNEDNPEDMLVMQNGEWVSKKNDMNFSWTQNSNGVLDMKGLYGNTKLSFLAKNDIGGITKSVAIKGGDFLEVTFPKGATEFIIEHIDENNEIRTGRTLFADYEYNQELNKFVGTNPYTSIQQILSENNVNAKMKKSLNIIPLDKNIGLFLTSNGSVVLEAQTNSGSSTPIPVGDWKQSTLFGKPSLKINFTSPEIVNKIKEMDLSPTFDLSVNEQGLMVVSSKQIINRDITNTQKEIVYNETAIKAIRTAILNNQR